MSNYPSNLDAVPSLSKFSEETDSLAVAVMERGIDRIQKAFGHTVTKEKPNFVTYVITVSRRPFGRYSYRVWPGNVAANTKQEVGRWYLNGKMFWRSDSEGPGYYVQLRHAMTGVFLQESNFHADRFIGEGPGNELEPITGEELGIPFGNTAAKESGGSKKWRNRNELIGVKDGE